MKNNNEETQKINNKKKSSQSNDEIPPWEKLIFLILITFVGGYMNAYTYITRNGILANMHTANMSKLGINLALGHWKNALSFFIPIAACVLGAAFSELTKSILIKNNSIGDWRKVGLCLESVALFCIGLLPKSIPDLIVTNLVSFFMGYLLCLFRNYLNIGYNTTICTGNLRNVGQLLYNTVDEKNVRSIKIFFNFSILTFSFPIGALLGTIISNILNIKSVWVCSFILLSQAFWMYRYELKNKTSP